MNFDDLPDVAKAAYIEQHGDPKAAGQPRPNKFSAEPVVIDGKRYDSRREAAFHNSLKLLHKAGDIVWWMEQPRLLLPGPTWYFPDFIVLVGPLCEACAGLLRIIDTKGFKTPMYRLKKRQVREIYSIEIVEE